MSPNGDKPYVFSFDESFVRDLFLHRSLLAGFDRSFPPSYMLHRKQAVVKLLARIDCLRVWLVVNVRTVLRRVLLVNSSGAGNVDGAVLG